MKKTQLVLALGIAALVAAAPGCGSKDPEESVKPVSTKPANFKAMEGDSKAAPASGGGESGQRPGAGAPPGP